MNAKQQKALAIGLVGAGVVAALTLGGSKKAKAAARAPVAPEEIEGEIDLDNIPDPEPQPEPEAQSPGWPQPAPQPQPQPQPTAQLPQIPASIPTSLPVPLPPLPSIPGEPEPTQNVPVPSIVVPPRPPASTAELPVAAPEDTVTMVQRLLSQEASPNWKTRDPVVKAWQEARQLVADGEFGPNTALRVADEFGVIPLVRFWPKGSYPEGSWIRDYQAALITKANASPQPKRSQLMASADREKGQGFARNVKAETNVVTLQQAVAPMMQDGPNV